MRVKRSDAGTLGAPVKTSHGMRYEARVASTAPMTYRGGLGGGLGDHEEQRSVHELSRFVQQLPGAPVTLMHAEGMMKSGGSAVVVGHVVDARLETVDGVPHAVATLEVTDPMGIKAVRAGVKDISLGYTADLQTDASGAHWQTNVGLDHVALVPEGRCTTCELRGDRLDCAGACACKRPATADEFDIDLWNPTTDTFERPSGAGDTMRRADARTTTITTKQGATITHSEDPDDDPDDGDENELRDDEDDQSSKRLSRLQARAMLGQPGNQGVGGRHTADRVVDASVAVDDTDEDLARAAMIERDRNMWRGGR
ncbi:MAG TPA: DUF2213 domain-containing protein [Kofleriaceae bacterium]|jgi:hypothetical protein